MFADVHLDTFVGGHLEHILVRKSLVAGSLLPAESIRSQRERVVGRAQNLEVLATQRPLRTSVQHCFHHLPRQAAGFSKVASWAWGGRRVWTHTCEGVPTQRLRDG